MCMWRCRINDRPPLGCRRIYAGARICSRRAETVPRVIVKDFGRFESLFWLGLCWSREDFWFVFLRIIRVSRGLFDVARLL